MGTDLVLMVSPVKPLNNINANILNANFYFSTVHVYSLCSTYDLYCDQWLCLHVCVLV